MSVDKLRAIAEQIGALFRRRRVEAELDEELQHHLEMETRANLRMGMNPREARRQAFLAFGGTDWFSERIRDGRWGQVLEDLARDIRFGVRNLRKRIVFTGSAALTLSLGIGMTTTMFVLVDAVLLRPLPGANTEGVVYLEVESEERLMSASPTPPAPAAGPRPYDLVLRSRGLHRRRVQHLHRGGAAPGQGG